MRVTTALSFAAAVASVQAAIVALKPFTSTYHATSTSRISLTFQTAETLVEHDDFSIALGVYPAAASLNGTQLGTFWANVDLVALGKSSNGGADVVIPNLPLHASSFSGSGTYKVVAAVTYGNFPNQSISVDFFSAPLNVTV